MLQELCLDQNEAQFNSTNYETAKIERSLVWGRLSGTVLTVHNLSTQ